MTGNAARPSHFLTAAPLSRKISSASLVLLAGFCVLFIGGGSRFALGLMLRPIAEEFSWQRSVLGGWLSDRRGPAWPTALSFGARVAVFALILVDQSAVSVAIFAIVFGMTFLVTAPLTVVFVMESFGARHLGALTGLITMVHQIFGGIGAWLGAAVFDTTGGYNPAFATMGAVSLVALVLTLQLRRAPPKIA